MTKRFLTADGTDFECTEITTGISSIRFRQADGSADEMKRFFGSVTELTTALKEGGVPCGTYKNLAFERASVYADGSVEVEMRIKTETEMRLDALEAGQAVQNGAIAELGRMNGGGE